MHFRLKGIASYVFGAALILAASAVFAQSSIPEVGPGCQIDPQTGGCVTQPSPSPVQPAPVPVPVPVIEISSPILTPAPASKPKTPASVPAVSAPAVQAPPVAAPALNPFFALWDDPAVQSFVRRFAVPVSITIAVVSGSTLLFVAAAGNVQFAVNLSNLFQFLDGLRIEMLGLVRFKKRKPWGRVLDELNGKPVPGALVHLYGAEFGKMVDSSVTDERGRFEFLVAQGRYFLRASHKGFAVRETKPMTIQSPEEVIDLEVLLAPVMAELNIGILRSISVINLIFRFIDALNPYLLAGGTLVSIAAAAAMPSALNYVIFGVYVACDLIHIFLAFRLIRPSGNVFDHASKQPLPLAVVRIFDAQKNILITTKVSDRNGKFHVLLVSGSYYVTCVKQGYPAYHSAPFAIRSDQPAEISVAL